MECSAVQNAAAQSLAQVPALPHITHKRAHTAPYVPTHCGMHTMQTRTCISTHQHTCVHITSTRVHTRGWMRVSFRSSMTYADRPNIALDLVAALQKFPVKGKKAAPSVLAILHAPACARLCTNGCDQALKARCCPLACTCARRRLR